MKIKIIYNSNIIDDLDLFKNETSKIQNQYKKEFLIEESNDVKLDLLINNKIVFTLDDSFDISPISTSLIIDKINHQIYSYKILKRSKQDSKFDDIGLIDF